MPRITKGMIQAAYHGLDGIRDTCRESGDATCWSRNAYSATVYMETLSAARQPPPDWVKREEKFLKAHGWRFPYRFV